MRVFLYLLFFMPQTKCRKVSCTTAITAVGVALSLLCLPCMGTFSMRAQERNVHAKENEKNTWDEKQDSLKQESKRTILAVKTNLLFDAVTALNVEVEVPVGRRFSIMAEDVFPWWAIGNKYCFQLWEMGLEGRFWFKAWDPAETGKLRGFFAGVYGMSGKYDFQWDRSINYQGEFWSAGVTGGWCLPIGKRKGMNLEFSISLGYMRSPWRHYMPSDDYDRLMRDKNRFGTLDYFGPTKAKISLVVPINVRNKKEVRHD